MGLKRKDLEVIGKGLQNLYAWVRFPPAPPNFSHQLSAFSSQLRRQEKTDPAVISVTASCAVVWHNKTAVMESFAIITNRKRAIIALVHSVFFLGVAGLQLAISHAEAFSIHREKIAGSIILLAIYVIVTTVLLVLLRFSHCAKEKLYFAFCAAGAAFGLVRILLGDPVLHANVARVLLLFCAVLTGAVILRNHSAVETGQVEAR